MATIDLTMSDDIFFLNTNPTTNYNNTTLGVGESDAAAEIRRSWIKPDFSPLPPNLTFLSAILKLTPIADYSNSVRTLSAHRCLRDVVSNQATWNIWKTGNNWGTAGCSNPTTDYDGAVAIGTMTQPASPTLNVALEMTLNAAEFQKLYDGTYTNNGIVLFVDTQNADQIRYASTDNLTSAYRPIISLVYKRTGGLLAWF